MPTHPASCRCDGVPATDSNFSRPKAGKNRTSIGRSIWLKRKARQHLKNSFPLWLVTYIRSSYTNHAHYLSMHFTLRWCPIMSSVEEWSWRQLIRINRVTSARPQSHAPLATCCGSTLTTVASQQPITSSRFSHMTCFRLVGVEVTTIRSSRLDRSQEDGSSIKFTRSSQMHSSKFQLPV